MSSTLKEVEQNIADQCDRDWADWSKEKRLAVCMAGLSEEVGEVEGIYKRMLRQFPKDGPRTTREKQIEELGDVLWYLVATSHELGFSLQEMWEYNVKKLEERYGPIKKEYTGS